MATAAISAEVLKVLIRKWRREAKFGSDGYKNHYHQLEECADELETLLRLEHRLAIAEGQTPGKLGEKP